MQYREIAHTHLRPSVIGFGVWTVSTGMWGIHDPAVGIDLLQHAFELGINFYDTADVYGDGLGETILHDALSIHRDEIVIATKFGYDFINNPGIQPGQRERPQNWTPAFVRAACEASLKRLQTDRIDVYQMHNPRLDAMQSDDLIAVLDSLQQEGKILSYGAALGPALKPDRQIEEGLYAVRERRMLVHIIYNLLEQQLAEPICPEADRLNVPVLVRVPHASGVLEGTYTTQTEFSPNDHRSHRVTTDEMKRQWLDMGLLKLEKLRFACEEAGRTPGQMALCFLMADPAVKGIFPNIYDRAQLEEFAAAADVPPFTADEMQKVQNLYRNNFYLDVETAAV